MKEIKFRIFNKKTNQMEEIISYDKARNLINDKPLYHFINSKHEKLSYLMPFTGYKDINKKEIYEYDIIEFSQSVVGKPSIGIVRFNLGSFHLKYPNGESVLMEGFMGREWLFFRIIGNAYENPELVKDYSGFWEW